MSANPTSLTERHTERESRGDSSPLSTHLLLFAVTTLCVFHAGALYVDPYHGYLRAFIEPKFLAQGAWFAVPLLSILLAHEFGHYFAARYHRVPASLPYFIPLPAGWGTLGAVIAMRERIRSRNALFDIGASGPLAGLVVAIPVLAWGLLHSPVQPMSASGYEQEGQSLLYLLMKRVLLGPIPEGYDVQLHPTATAGWFGLLVTMVNLLPWGQLDGGHIAFSLFGERQHRIARWLRRGLPLLFLGNLLYFVVPVLLGRSELGLVPAVMNSLFWLVWFFVLGVIGQVAGGPDHPPFEPGPLSPLRRVLAWVCLGLFVLLFMPTPLAQY
ncbi:MAG TPA: site-2 protease family protein [Polyangiaceae bacterium]|jgi:membrane-associated protease RseP (regulator of RpoE activity)|nr:site-2 protease family protein [Polyangiaceae bacterium]